MAGMLDGLLGQLTAGGATEQMSRELGTDPATTNAAIGAALPVLMAALAKNASSPTGAQALAGALERDHDGSGLDNLSGLLGAALGGAGASKQSGASILGHVLGGRQPAVAQSLGAATGLDSGKTMKLLMMLAPVVLAYLGRQKREQNLDAGGLGGMLGQEREQIQATRGGQLGGLMSMLDRDGDGSVADDVGGMLGGMFKR